MQNRVLNPKTGAFVFAFLSKIAFASSVNWAENLNNTGQAHSGGDNSIFSLIIVTIHNSHNKMSTQVAMEIRVLRKNILAS